MTQPLPRLAIPEGLTTARRTMHWSLKMLLLGITVSIVGCTGYVTTVAMSVSGKISTRFPDSYRKEARERMSKVSPLLKETVFYTECPIIPSVLDPLPKRAKVMGAQLSTHHGIADPYVEHEALKDKSSLWAVFMENLVAHMIVEYRFPSDEQLDLFLDGVTFTFEEGESAVAGVVAASQKRFGKSPEKLTPLEVARLAASIYYPRQYIGRPDPQITEEQVLLKMAEKELITRAELDLALKDPSITRERYPASDEDEFPSLAEE